jgi:hypothetical protein
LNLHETRFLNELWGNFYGHGSDNFYRSVKVYSNRIYLLYNSITDTFGSTSTDIVLSIIDYRTGLELSTKFLGSPSDDNAIDIVVNRIGVFVLADIGDGFKDSSSSDSYSTQNTNSNFAIMLMNYDGDIQEIESYDSSDAANDLGAPYPKKLVVGRQNKNGALFTFISTRDDGTNNQGGGVYITQPASQSLLFATGNSVGAFSPLAN